MEPFGTVLRSLRQEAGLGIKRLAPELGVTYSYLSKLETNQSHPSAEFVNRVSDYFGYDRNLLLLSADKVPPEILLILQERPDEAIDFLRRQFGTGQDRPQT
jgi:transcriptional regulator with XRE-family HTH domain